MVCLRAATRILPSGLSSLVLGGTRIESHMFRHVTHQLAVTSLVETRRPNSFKIPQATTNPSTAFNPCASEMSSTRPTDGRPVVISGPSGVGKGTLVQKLFDSHPNTFAFTVSHTTRAPRAGEVDGINYFFVTPSAFADLVSEGGFVEHATFGANQYGTSRRTIADQNAKGLVVVLDIEMNGVKQMKANSSIDARYVFISPPNFEALETRLRGRGTESEESIQKRLAQARAELDYAETGVHDKIIVNDDLQVAFNELEDFIFQR